MKKSSLGTIFLFFISDRKNWFFLPIQVLLSTLCSTLSSLEFFVLAIVIPEQTSSVGQLGHFLQSIRSHVVTLPLWMLATGLLLAFLMRSLLNLANSLLQDEWNHQTESSQRAKLLNNLVQQPISQLEHQEPGALAKQIDLESAQLAQIPNFVITYWVQLPISIVQALVVCWLISWKLVLLFAPVFAAYYFIKKQISKKAAHLSEQSMHHLGTEHAKLFNLFQGLSILKIFKAETHFLDSYFQIRSQIRNNHLKLSKTRNLFSELIVFMMSVLVVLSLTYVFFVLKKGVQDILLLMGTVKQLQGPIKSYTQQTGFAERAAGLIQKTQEAPKAAIHFSKPSHNSPTYQIEFDRVSFSYGSDWSLKPVSFGIKPGEKIALVGPNGAGKSTLLKLLAGFYPTHHGNIYLPQGNLMSDICYTTQKPFLFSGSIRANIEFYRQLDLLAIQQACKQSCIAEHIETLPDQYDSLISNDGSGLSGGQRQKIHLARSFARQTPILLLDEATASLDLASEAGILANCRQNTWQTQIVVSHRKEIRDWADRVIELG